MNYADRAKELRAAAAKASGLKNWNLRLAAAHFEAAVKAKRPEHAEYHARHGAERAEAA